MDQDTQLKFARAMCEKKRTRKEYVSLKRKYTLRCRQNSTSESSSCEATPDQPRFHGTLRTLSEREERQLKYTAQFARLAVLPSRSRRFPLPLMMMAISLYLISGSAYNYARNFIPLTSVQAISKKMNGLVNLNPTLLLNLSSIGSTAADVRARYEVGDDVIAGILAVDAISFQGSLL